MTVNKYIKVIFVSLIIAAAVASITLISINHKPTKGRDAKPEVYCILSMNETWMRPREWWQPFIDEHNLQLATLEQLKQAHAAGAQWCRMGFLADGTIGWPMHVTKSKCGVAGINHYNTTDVSVGSIVIYGVKPPVQQQNYTTIASILPFDDRSKKWSRYD